MTRLEFVSRVVLAVAALAIIPAIVFVIDLPWAVGLALQVPNVIVAWTCGHAIGEAANQRFITKNRARWAAEDAAKAAEQ